MQDLYDLIIVGGGPAGLSAAIYMARARYRVLVLEKDQIGGQITITSEIVNYPGVEKTSGRALTRSMQLQAEAFGAEFAIAEVMDMELAKEIKVLHTTKGDYRTLGVILATGANPRKLGFKGEKEFQGRGVAYCATCDGEFFTGMDVYVIGGGFAAVEEGIFLTKYAKKVTMIVREEDFTCAKAVADEVKKHGKIEVHFHTEIVEAGGEHSVSHARFRNNQTGEEWTVDAGEDGGFGIFVFAGYVPNTAWFGNGIELDAHGYVITDTDHKTNLPGVYAAGDLCVKNLRQVVTAVSDGAAAATSLEKYVSALHESLGLPEFTMREADTSKLGADQANGGSPSENKTHELERGKEGHPNQFFTPEIRQQLKGIFSRFQNRVILKIWLDDSSLSGEIGNFAGELETLTDRVEILRASHSEAEARRQAGGLMPSIELLRADGSAAGIEFHGVPGGHEINSFIIALYNTAGPGQQIDPETERRIKALDKDINVKIMVSLSCTMCPEVVMACQKAASLSDRVNAEMIDLMHYPQLKEKYRVMSVPCMVINDEQVYFGKKNLEEVAELLEKAQMSGKNEIMAEN